MLSITGLWLVWSRSCSACGRQHRHHSFIHHHRGQICFYILHSEMALVSPHLSISRARIPSRSARVRRSSFSWSAPSELVTCHHTRPLDTVDTSQQIFPDHQYQSQWPPSPTPSSDIRYLLFTFLDLPKAKYIYAYLAQKAQLSIEYWCPNTYFLMFCDKVLTAFLMYLWRQYWYAKLRRKALHDIDPELQFCLYKALGSGCHHY